MACCKCTRKCAIVGSVFLAILCALCIVGASMGPFLLNHLILEGIKQQRIVTSPNSTGYDRWVSSDFEGAPEMLFSVYLFNVTNPEEVQSGAKPRLVQVGPFVYTYHWHFFNISWSEDKNTVQNMKFESYKFRPKDSISDPKTTYLTLLNIPYSAVRAKVDPDLYWPTALAFELLSSAASASLFVNVTAHDFVWKYESPLLKWLNQNVDNSTTTIFNLQYNHTSEQNAAEFLKGQFDEYYTGNNDTLLLNHYIKWHGMRDLSVWGSDDANDVRGADGLGFEIGIPKEKNLTVFVDTLYRHLELWHNETEVVKGVTLNKYFLDQRSFYNVSMNNSAYNLYAPKGLNNMTGPESVLQSIPVPIFMSLPLFFQSDDSYFQAVDFTNVKPDINLHNTEICVEPITGITMKAAKRVQVNCRIDPTFWKYRNLPTTYFPVAWFEVASSITDDIANEYKGSVSLALTVRYYCPYVLSGLAGLLLIGTALSSHRAHKERKKAYYEEVCDVATIQ